MLNGFISLTVTSISIMKLCSEKGHEQVEKTLEMKKGVGMAK